MGFLSAPQAAARRRPSACGLRARGEKRWWATTAHQALRPLYMRCLLEAEVHRKAVPHFRQEVWYAALLDGRDYTPKLRFKLETAGGDTSGRPAKRQRRGRRAGAVAAEPGEKHAIEDGPGRGLGGEASSSESGASTEEAVEEQELGDLEQEAEEELGTDAGASAGESGTSTVTSQESSSSSSSSADSDRDDHGACVLPGPGRLGDETEMWKTFKFTPIFNHLRVTIGWECRCSRPNHRARGMAACSRTFRFAAHGGREATERSLKWWCQQAFATGSRGDHMKMPAEDAAGNLPSLAALEAWRPPDEHLEAVEAAELHLRRSLRFPGGASSSAKPAGS